MNIRSVGTDGHEGALAYVEPFHELEHDEARHDLGEAGALALLPFELAEEESVGLLVIDRPRLSTAMGRWLVHQDLGKLDFLCGYAVLLCAYEHVGISEIGGGKLFPLF